MTGLEKILKAIETDARANADAILSKANKEAEELIENARADAEKKCSEIAQKSETEVKAVLSRAKSAAMLQERQIILNAKQQMINNMIVNAKNTLINLSDEEYTEVVIRMVKKYAHREAGKIAFSEKDLKRLPKDFNLKLQNALTDKVGASLTLSEVASKIDGGFLLVYGDIEENCSFDAIFSAAKEELQDKVNTFLFE